MSNLISQAEMERS
jgi:hypothetical protein